jgi:hypothetical protein
VSTKPYSALGVHVETESNCLLFFLIIVCFLFLWFRSLISMCFLFVFCLFVCLLQIDLRILLQCCQMLVVRCFPSVEWKRQPDTKGMCLPFPSLKEVYTPLIPIVFDAYRLEYLSSYVKSYFSFHHDGHLDEIISNLTSELPLL